ncbi:formin-like protein 5 [Gopherus evgoodei]|uniref:formin-like protein 5 n=1 Tax=Gopherus evgoodei TaxID=1825980 RepID=UPI0011CF3290|nr:formin-like protein 5 [Gopherus evgoodei]
MPRAPTAQTLLRPRERLQRPRASQTEPERPARVCNSACSLPSNVTSGPGRVRNYISQLAPGALPLFLDQGRKEGPRGQPDPPRTAHAVPRPPPSPSRGLSEPPPPLPGERQSWEGLGPPRNDPPRRQERVPTPLAALLVPGSAPALEPAGQRHEWEGHAPAGRGRGRLPGSPPAGAGGPRAPRGRRGRRGEVTLRGRWIRTASARGDVGASLRAGEGCVTEIRALIILSVSLL